MLKYICPCCGREIVFRNLLKGIHDVRERICNRCRKLHRKPKRKKGGKHEK